MNKFLDAILRASETQMDRTASEAEKRYIKTVLGFDPDDPNVRVAFIPRRAVVPQDLDEGVKGVPYSSFSDRLKRDVTAAVTDEDSLRREDPPTANPVPENGDERWERLQVHADHIINDELWLALKHAITKHRGMTSPHEGHNVIREEFEELWDEIKADGGGRDAKARKEALQVAATAIRYVLDLDPH